jgi:hypothetical protein
MPLSMGQGSGGFAETRARIQAFHVGQRNSTGILTPDSFTQANPFTATNPSTTLTGITTRGVLGATVAFTRNDVGNGFIGGPTASTALRRPLGLFINDAVGNAFENTPGVASGRGPYFCGGGTFGVALYETLNLNSAAALVYAPGDYLFASKNGLLTNVLADNNLVEQAATAPGASLAGVVVMGIVKISPDANNHLLVLDLRV